MSELIWSFETPNFSVRVDALPEDDWDLSWDDTGEAHAGLENGRYVGFCARARVLDAEGNVLACDHLGNCIYASLQEFASPRPSHSSGERSPSTKRPTALSIWTSPSHLTIWRRY